MTGANQRRLPILGGIEAAVAPAHVAVSSPTRPRLPPRPSTELTPPPPDFRSALAISLPPAHTGRPGPNLSPLPLSARVAFSVLEGRPPRRFPRPRVRRLQPCTVPSAPLSADACRPDGLRPIPPHKHKEKP